MGLYSESPLRVRRACAGSERGARAQHASSSARLHTGFYTVFLRIEALTCRDLEVTATRLRL